MDMFLLPVLSKRTVGATVRNSVLIKFSKLAAWLVANANQKKGVIVT